MKIYQHLVAMFLLVSSATICAQTTFDGELADVEFGAPLKLQKGYFPVSFSPIDAESNLLLCYSKKDVGLSVVNSDLTLGAFSTVPKQKSSYSLYENVIVWHKQPYIVVTDYDKKNNTEILKFAKVNVDGNFDIDMIDMMKVDKKLKGNLMPSGFYGATKYNKFKFHYEDTSQYLVVTAIKEEENKNQNFEEVVVGVFDRELNLLWNDELKTVGELCGYAVKDDHFIFATHGFENEKGKFKSTLEVFKAPLKGGKTQKKTYNLERDGINSAMITFDENGSAMVLGYYLKNKKALEGFFAAPLNLETMELSKPKLYKFSKETLAEGMGTAVAKKLDKAEDKGKDISIPYLIPRQVLPRKGGGFYLVGEQYRYRIVVRVDNRGVRIERHYHHGSTFVSAVDASGEQVWTAKAPKSQHFVDLSTFGGYKVIQYNDNIYIVNLDLHKNSQMDENTKYFYTMGNGHLNPKLAAIVIHKINNKGDLSTEYLSCFKNEKQLFNIVKSSQIAPNKLMVNALGGLFAPKSTKLSIITLK